MKQVRCDSGLIGWQMKLRKVYGSFACFVQHDEIYNLVQRLGFNTPEEAWKANPTVQGSVNPGDYRVVEGA